MTCKGGSGHNEVLPWARRGGNLICLICRGQELGERLPREGMTSEDFERLLRN